MAAQNLVLSDQSARALITTVGGAPIIDLTSVYAYRLIDAVKALNQIKPLFSVDWSIVGGGFTNLIIFRPTSIVDTLAVRFSTTTPAASAVYQLEFGGSAWEQEAITQALKVKDAFLALNDVNLLSTVSLATGPFQGFIESPNLSTGLFAYWAMEETTGSRLDSHGSNHLLEDVSAIGFASGKHGNASNFTASSSLTVSMPSDPLVKTNAVDLTFTTWYKRSDTNGASSFGFNNGGTRLNAEFAGAGASTVTLIARDAVDNGTNHNVVGQDLTSYSFLVFRWNSLLNEFRLSINGGADSAAAFMSDPTGSPLSLVRFGIERGSHVHNFDEVGLWLRRLTDTEVAYLYNAGSGRFY